MKTCLFTAIRITLTTLVLIVLVIGSFVAYQGNQPMSQPEAQGLTYWQFIANRWQATQELPAECHARWTTIWLAHLPMDAAFGTLFTVKALFPNAPIRIMPTQVTVPAGIAWAQAPEIFWSVVEQMAVISFVRVQGRECVLPAVPAGESGGVR